MLVLVLLNVRMRAWNSVSSSLIRRAWSVFVEKGQHQLGSFAESEKHVV